MSKRVAAIIFGGLSTEHSVSCVSASAVAQHFPHNEYQLLLIGIASDGSWYLYNGDYEAMATGKWQEDKQNTPAFISPDRGVHGVFLPNVNKTVRLDVVFPVLHGKNGEDGTVQGLLTLAGIPYVGCKTASSAICMDKIFQKSVAGYHGIPQAKWIGFNYSDYKKDWAKVVKDIEKLGYPCFVKPANGGSSVGITKAHNMGELIQGIEDAAKVDSRILAEENVDGQEIECAVLGNEHLTVSVCGEILSSAEFYDYTAKYRSNSRLVIPARLSCEKAEEIRSLSAKVYRAFDCKDLTRVDFFVRRKDGAVLLNEPNTIPGFTPISMYPKLINEMGISFPQLISRLLKNAVCG